MPTDRRRFLAAGAALAAPSLWAQEPAAKPADALATPESERAVERGLAFLGRTQADDGSFGDRQLYRGNVAVTSLAALAFMAGGHQPGRGTYGEAVRRALEFVLSKEQRSPAGFLHNPVGPQQLQMYAHGFGTLFLAEVYGMIPDEALQKRTRDALERAVQLIVKAQNSEGGWRYQPYPQMADVSVTICQIMALRAARNAGLLVPKSTVDRCVKYVLDCQTADGGFAYMRQQGPSAFARTAAAVVALYCAGIYKGKPIDRALEYMRDYHPANGTYRRDIPEMHYYYAQYYAAQAMWTAGDKHWEDWFPAIRDELVTRTRQRGDGVWTDVTTCSHYATAMACVILQISNNYLPILQK